MKCNFRVTGTGLALFLQSGFALNPIHESSYNLLPRGKFASSATLAVGGIIYSGENSVFHLPVSVTLEGGPRLELGAGLKTRWGEADNHIPYLVFGIKYLALSQTSVQADLLVGADFNSGKGLSLATHHRFGYSSRFYSRLTGRVGFMDALVRDDALMAMELGFYPTLVLVRPLSFELGLITSSQTKNFDRYFALDLQPALQVHIGRESVVETAVTIGLAGDRREDLRVKVVVIYGF